MKTQGALQRIQQADVGKLKLPYWKKEEVEQMRRDDQCGRQHCHG